MSETEGFWISPEGKTLSISDHFNTVRESPRMFGFTPKEAEKWTRADREEVLRKAIDRSWIRVRGHRTHTTFEIDRLNEDAATRIKEFLVATSAWESEPIEVHELGRKRRWAETAGFFLEERHLAVLGKKQGRVARTQVPAGIAEAAWNEDFLRDLDFRPEGGTDLVRIDGEGASVGAVVREPGSPKSPSLVGGFVMGLRSGFGKEEEFTPAEVRADVMEAFPEGGTIMLQLGWFRRVQEDSIRVLVENSGTGLSDREFVDAFNGLVERLVEKYRQNEIWVEYYKGSERVESLKLRWVP